MGENIVFTTLIIFVLAIPGYVARSFYHTKQLTKALLPKRLSDDLVASIAFSFPLHAIAFGISEKAYHDWELVRADIQPMIIFRFLAGEFGKDSELLNSMVANAYDHVNDILGYAALVLTLSVVFGWFLRVAVWNLKLDLRIPFLFRFGNYWLYRATGRGIVDQEIEKLKRTLDVREMEVLTTVDALVEVNGKTQLYSGLLMDLNVDERGALVDLVLKNTVRFKIEERMVAGEVKVDYHPIEIEGDVFIVKWSHVNNLNVLYMGMDPISRELNFL